MRTKSPRERAGRRVWPSAVEVEISGFDVVEGSVRIYVQSVVVEPGRWLSSATTDSVLVAVAGWHRNGRRACCVGGAGRDLRHVGVRGGERCGPSHGLCTDVAGRKLESGDWRSGMTRL